MDGCWVNGAGEAKRLAVEPLPLPLLQQDGADSDSGASSDVDLAQLAPLGRMRNGPAEGSQRRAMVCTKFG